MPAADVEIDASLGALHQPAPGDAPLNPVRGVPLAERHDVVLERIRRVEDLVDASSLLDLWTRLSGTRPWAGPPLWLHGDLHPANVLVSEGRVTAVIDFGDLCAGDPATDLSIAWMMFPAAVRPLFRTTARAGAPPPDDDTWARARAWALALGLAYLAHSHDKPTMGALGRRTLSAVLTDEV